MGEIQVVKAYILEILWICKVLLGLNLTWKCGSGNNENAFWIDFLLHVASDSQEALLNDTRTGSVQQTRERQASSQQSKEDGGETNPRQVHKAVMKSPGSPTGC